MKLFKEKDVVKAIDDHTDDNGKLDDDITCILEEVPAVEKEEETMMSYDPKVGTFLFLKRSWKSCMRLWRNESMK